MSILIIQQTNFNRYNITAHKHSCHWKISFVYCFLFAVVKHLPNQQKFQNYGRKKNFVAHQSFFDFSCYARGFANLKANKLLSQGLCQIK